MVGGCGASVTPCSPCLPGSALPFVFGLHITCYGTHYLLPLTRPLSGAAGHHLRHLPDLHVLPALAPPGPHPDGRSPPERDAQPRACGGRCTEPRTTDVPPGDRAASPECRGRRRHHHRRRRQLAGLKPETASSPHSGLAAVGADLGVHRAGGLGPGTQSYRLAGLLRLVGPTRYFARGICARFTHMIPVQYSTVTGEPKELRR